MTDKELLELAAKAAGWSFPPEIEPGTIVSKQWNPLLDDGDALRLAVKLKISIYRAEASDMITECGYFYDKKLEWVYLQETSDDPYATTRRAIVRAAAEIGKSK